MAIPEKPFTRTEAYLDAIAKKGGGGGGGGSDLSTLEALTRDIKAQLITANATLASINENLVDGENEEY